MNVTFVVGMAMMVVLGSTAYANDSEVITNEVPMAVNSVSSGDSVVGAPASGTVSRSGKDTMIVRLVNSCFPTNLRAVTNPLAKSSLVTADINILIGAKTYNIKAEYPATIVGERSQSPTMVFSGTVTNMKAGKFQMTPEGGTASMYGNVVEFRTKIPTGVSVDNSATITVSKDNVALGKMKFEQEIIDCNTGPVWGEYGYSAKIPTYGCGEFMGKDGEVSATIAGFNVAPDRSVAEIFISYPGETGFCGGFWSPLMVFFDDNLPTFNNVSSFPLNPDGKTYWPDKNGPGFFLGFDRDKNGKIDKKNELFGNSIEFDNGFEALKELDTNKDGVIDAKDKDFKRLVLWNDKNGDGVSQKSEMTKARMKLTKIELNYESIHRTRGPNAEIRQRSKFYYTDAKGKEKTGIVYDVWIAPYTPPSLADSK